MLQNPRKTLGFKKNMVYKIPPGGGGTPYPASGLISVLNMHTFHQKMKEIRTTSQVYLTLNFDSKIVSVI